MISLEKLNNVNDFAVFTGYNREGGDKMRNAKKIIFHTK